MFSVLSWNVNGIRSNVIPHLQKFVDDHQIDFVCLQETKLTESSFEAIKLNGYTPHFSISKNTKKARQAYAGVAIFVKDVWRGQIKSVSKNFLEDSHVDEGRFLAIELNDVVIATVYVPNSGTNREFRDEIWGPAIKKWTMSIKDRLILTGDFNSITTPHDVWWGKPQPSKNGKVLPEVMYHERVMKEHKDVPGVMPFEIDALCDLKESAGLTDVWKFCNPKEVYSGFTWFNMRARGARSQNKGWRIDYIFTNFKISEKAKCQTVNTERESSDHIPLYALI